ncbi:2'-5' RNA ligase family protein [Streptomyces triculaminicus]|uniref:2'-5' RNA ligase family protein n=1 Tax=Streptomyces triculaminicus TaxID=2816232 RepID=UPI00379608B0
MSPDFSDGCMICLYPPPAVAEALAVEGGLPPSELHVTVAYCAKAADVDAGVLQEVVEELAARQPITARIGGLARFSGGDRDVLVALVDSPDLEDLRRDALDALTAHGIRIPRDHGYTAHCTLTYLSPDSLSPLSRLTTDPVEFKALSCVHGTDRIDVPLAHPIAAPAREAFAAGWAASGGPMTDRVQAACRAAVQTAAQCADDPRILEVTVDLGRLEGMWALLFARREEQQATHTRAVTAAWRPMIDRVAIASAVDTVRGRAGLAEARRPLGDLAAEALAAARTLLRALADLTGWTALRTALRNAIAAGRAEGMVNAVAIAAERLATASVRLDWDIAFQHAYRSLEGLEELWAGADGWLARMVDGTADDLGRMLARAAEEGASRDEMIDAAMDLLTGEEIDSVAFTIDWAMTTAADEGALALYQSEGVLQIDIISAGDGRVCPSCIDAEAGSPWRIGDQPRMPLHPMCRCCYAADVSLSHFASWFA